MTITIKPEGERYIVLRDGFLAGYIAFRSGEEPWVVCTTDGEEISAHRYMNAARAAAKQRFG